MLIDLSRWDDWVTEERLRKLTEENRELAAHLKRNLEASLRLKQTKSTSKKRAASDRSSVRDSEDPGSSVAPARGSKRSRGDQHLQSVSCLSCCSKSAPPKRCPHSLSPLLFLLLSSPTTSDFSYHLRYLHPSTLVRIIFTSFNHHGGRRNDHLRSI